MIWTPPYEYDLLSLLRKHRVKVACWNLEVGIIKLNNLVYF